MKSTQIVVFDDGETWSPASTSCLYNVTAAQLKKLEAGNYPKHVLQKVKASAIEQTLLTKEMINDAPMYTVFKGPVHPNELVLTDEQWDLFTIGGSCAPAAPLVLREANKRGITLAHDIHGDLTAVMKDDELAPGGADDHDAGLAYIRAGGRLVKLPDSLNDKYYRLYPVLMHKEAHERQKKTGR